jgi:enterochelin esterase-like enzyme
VAVSASPVATEAAFSCDETKGQTVDLTFDSEITSAPIKYRAYLPPCYADTSRRYPYVILMPGSDKDSTEWTDELKINEALDTGISVQALPPMILIMTDGGDLMNTNVFQEGASWESVITDELMPEIEKNFCTWNDREGRAIGGISRGGFWAFEIGFRHPDLFSAIGGHSAFFDPDNAGPAYNPMALAKTVEFPPGQQPRIWLDVAQGDDVRPNIEIVQKTLTDRGIDSNYTMNPQGDHNVDYWSAHVTEYLAFYGQSWPHNAQELPSCLQ